MTKRGLRRGATTSNPFTHRSGAIGDNGSKISVHTRAQAEKMLALALQEKGANLARALAAPVQSTSEAPNLGGNDNARLSWADVEYPAAEFKVAL